LKLALIMIETRQFFLKLKDALHLRPNSSLSNESTIEQIKSQTHYHKAASCKVALINKQKGLEDPAFGWIVKCGINLYTKRTHNSQVWQTKGGSLSAP